MNRLLDLLIKEVENHGIDLNCSEREKILLGFRKILSEVIEENILLDERLKWLEDAVDDKNLEDIFIAYREKFKLEYWSG